MSDLTPIQGVSIENLAWMAELADAQDLKSCEDFPHTGSIPVLRIP